MKTVWIKMSAFLMAAMLTATALTSCTGGKKDGEGETTTAATTAEPATSTSNAAVRTGSEGLSFTVTGSGKCTLTGLGSCTDAAISVPSTDGAGNMVTAIAAGAFKSAHVSAIFTEHGGGVEISGGTVNVNVGAGDAITTKNLTVSGGTLKSITSTS